MKHCVSSYLFLEDSDIKNIRLADRESVSNKYPSGWQRRCFEQLGKDEEFDILRDGTIEFGVKNAFIEEIESPRFNVGEVVFISRKSSDGKVVRIHWHVKKCAPIYTIEVNGNESGFQYFDEHIEKIV